MHGTYVKIRGRIFIEVVLEPYYVLVSPHEPDSGSWVWRYCTHVKYVRYPNGCLILSAEYCIFFLFILLKLADLSTGITLVSFNAHYTLLQLRFFI